MIQFTPNSRPCDACNEDTPIPLLLTPPKWETEGIELCTDCYLTEQVDPVT